MSELAKIVTKSREKKKSFVNIDNSFIKNIDALMKLPKRGTAKTIKLPTARKYILSYRKSNNRVYNYTISCPIEEDKESITTYAFSRGIRKFLRKNILSIKEVILREVIA